jgi:hypothetical protein
MDGQQYKAKLRAHLNEHYPRASKFYIRARGFGKIPKKSQAWYFQETRVGEMIMTTGVCEDYGTYHRFFVESNHPDICASIVEVQLKHEY